MRARSCVDLCAQRPILYVYDSKALYHIFVKDQHIFEEVYTFLGWVSVVETRQNLED